MDAACGDSFTPPGAGGGNGPAARAIKSGVAKEGGQIDATRGGAPPLLPVIAGPTAGGKTGLGVALAQRLGEIGLPSGEVVSADSMQIYAGLDIGSAKPTAQEQGGIPHHLLSIADPRDRFSVSQWLDAAEEAIDSIRARARTPIVVGGTHLYIKSLLEGMFDGPGADEAIRAELAAMDPGERRRELERVDPPAAARIHPNDERRTVRALEVYRLTGRAISEHQQQWDRAAVRPGAVLIGLDWESGAINRRINARVRAMIEQGLVEEARGLFERGLLGPQAIEALGYKQLVAHFRGECALEEAVERIKIETRRFAKAQRTWLRRLRPTPGSLWIDAGLEEPNGWVETVLGHLAGPVRA